MTISFYNQLNDNRVLVKDLGEAIHTSTCTPYDECSIHNPVIKVRQFNGYANVNYCYIDEYGRYYYITDVIAKSGGLLEIHCRVDVLMTFKDVIKVSRGVCVANENVGSSFIPDENYPVIIKRGNDVYEFEGDPFNTETATAISKNFVLNVAGGTGGDEPTPETNE
jgi:hypothetical protein